ncbi:hypothetical protein GGS20DRAFT_28144 [Poronia punctata]|nr:hypothetical protein GGS20DRAFT_28144 [Poronia punctata]
MEDPVAVIGFGIRFPGDAVDESGFWEIIKQGKSTMTDVPPSRYNIDGFYSENPSNNNHLSNRGGHFINGDISAFDAPFFAMGSAEAKAMDPQLRIMLETTYHALENSGLTMETMRGSSTSVYVGNLTTDYSSLFDDEEVRAAYQATGMSGAMLSNRISWFYDLRGPSMTLDTACSSSLVGLHLACQGILHGETDMGLVGGVRLQLSPTTMTLPLARQNFLSPDSVCYSFDDRANGYSRAEGFGMVVLKRLSKAIADGNTIRAVIRGTSSNQDGRTPVISQPSAEAQAELIRKAYEAAGLEFKNTRYFEAHGTGTPVGDPIETEGISSVFSEHLTPENPMYIGSVKANIGHLESTAGVAGLIKAVLVLEHGMIPPNAMLQRLNPRIKAKEWNLEFPTTATPWPKDGQRRASVNSFGVGGANAHVVVDDALHYLQSRGLKGIHNTKIVGKDVLTNGNGNGTTLLTNGHANGHATKQSSLLLTLSAADEGGIDRIASSLGKHLQTRQGSTTYLQDLAFTFSEKRSLLPWKAYAVGSDVEELRKSLSNLPVQPKRVTQPLEVNFAFTGQGAQWANMGIELVDRYPLFREAIEFARGYFRSLGAEWDLIDELGETASTTRIDTPQLAQPFCTALQIALVDLLATLGIRPRAIVGHSSGEIAAAYAAGALSREGALRVAYFRGVAARSLAEKDAKRGSMLAVALSEADLAPYIAAVVGEAEEEEGVLSCGCVNSPQNTTVTGVERYVDALAEKLKADKVFNRKLSVPVAYHSPQMLAVADEYRKALGEDLRAHADTDTITSSEGYVQMISSVTGKLATRESLRDPEYWVRNLVSQVKFSEALSQLFALSDARNENVQKDLKALPYVIEVGPHAALERPIRETLKDSDFIYGTVLRRDVSPVVTMQRLVGDLFVNNHGVNMPELNASLDIQRSPKMVLDLPLYPFNHSRSYWLESRLSHNRRTREHPRHDFLGNPDADWNPLKPKWRFTVRVSDLPWVVEHKVDGTVVYPGTGYLVMVLEAVRSLTRGSPDVSGFRIRDVKIPNALVIPEDEDGIETQLHMHAHNDQGYKVWDFNIYSVTCGDWKLHCSGQVAASETSSTSDAVSETNTRETSDALSAFDKRAPAGRDSGHFYKLLHQRGYHFGGKFKTLENIRVMAGEEAMGEVKFAHFREQMSRGEVSDHLIHPATLDGLFHVMMATQYKGDSLPRVVPTHLSEIYVSLNGLGDREMNSMVLHGRVNESNSFGIKGDITAVSGRTGEPVVTMRGCKFSTLASMERRAVEESTSLFHRMHWKPDITLLSPEQLEKYLRETIPDRSDEEGDIKAEIVCRHFMYEAFREKSRESWSTKPHMLKYIEWADSFNITEAQSTAHLIETEWPEFKDGSKRPDLISEWARGASWKAKIAMFCKRLGEMLREEIDPLDLMFNQGVAESIYQSPMLETTTSRVAAYVDLLAHKNSGMNILEVGAGTGSTTNKVMDALIRHGGQKGASARFNRYDFTDISPSFFAEAQERFTKYTSRVNFKVLDLERDPVDQGFEEGSYDLVVAAAVLHATASIDKTINHVKKLLKPGGHIVLSEPTNKMMVATSGLFGLLPGWWLAIEPYRPSGPLMNPPEWNEAFKRSGFQQLQISLLDNAEHKHMTALLATSLPSPSLLPQNKKSNLSMAILTRSSSQQGLAEDIKAQLNIDGVTSYDIIPMESVSAITKPYTYCLCLAEFEEPFMSELGEARFAVLQDMMRKFRHVVWTTSRCGTLPETPESVMMSGFAKALMREDPSRTLIYLNVNTLDRAADTIARVMGSVSKVPGNLAETDLMEENGVVYVPRVVEAPQANTLLDTTMYGQTPRPVEVNGEFDNDAIELRFTPGRLDSLHFGPDDSSYRSTVKDDEVRVHVKATGISYRDVMIMVNQLLSGEPGVEVAGIVAEAGAKAGFAVGERVCALVPSGGFRSHVRVKASQILRIPENMSFTEASAVPLAFMTAQYALCHVARIRAGERVLIHAAAGGVGQAAIQIAQRVGATIYVTVSTGEKKALLVEKYGIDPNHCFSSRNVAFAQQVMRQTDGRGVDVVLNSLSGLALAETWRCMAPFGRFVELGKRDMLASKNLPMDPFLQNVSYSSVDMELVAKLSERLMVEVRDDVQNLLAQGVVSPHPVTTFKLSELESALRWLHTGQHSGRAVVSWELPDTIQTITRSVLDYQFDSNSTYVITGGLGGIGRSLAFWMASLGARHLVLLSRSGLKSDAAKDLAAKLEKDGVEVYAPPCDVSDVETVNKVFKHVQANMPPIKGCIHGALVVVNRLILDFSYQEFQANLDPKIRGTWNLHNSLPTNLDFFVMLSSIAGVNGAPSQSPYAAASIFEDAFARYRHARGQHCVSLDLGVVRDVGYVAERVDVARFLSMSMTDHKSLTESEVHFMLKYACRPLDGKMSPWDTQLIGALTTPAFIRRKGVVEDYGWMRMPVFCHLYQMEQEAKTTSTVNNSSGGGDGNNSVEAQLASTKTITEAAEVITKALARRLARALAVTVKDIDVGKPPFTFGVDSLVAVELIYWFSNEVRADIPVIQILGNNTIAQLGAAAAGVSGFVPVEVREGVNGGSS